MNMIINVITVAMIPPAKPSINDSEIKIRLISLRRAPIAFITPISRVRSTTLIYKTTTIMIAETRSEIPAIPANTPVNKSSIVVNVSTIVSCMELP